MTPRAHVNALRGALRSLDSELDRIDAWGEELGGRLLAGARLLAAGNGGSAAEAQHLTSELVGRYVEDRVPLSAIALCTDAAAVTAIGNDFGIEEIFARQVRAHGRAGDVLVALSTSGTSPNVLAAVDAARETGLTTWALTGPGPCALADACDDALHVRADATATIQEVHLVVVHLLCAAVDREVSHPDSRWAPVVGRRRAGAWRTVEAGR